MSAHISNIRPKPDQVLVDIVDYVTKYKIASKEAYETARYCLIDTLGCGLEALTMCRWIRWRHPGRARRGVWLQPRVHARCARIFRLPA